MQLSRRDLLRGSALAAGASVCLRKPLDGDTLLHAVTTAVHHAERSGNR